MIFKEEKICKWLAIDQIVWLHIFTSMERNSGYWGMNRVEGILIVLAASAFLFFNLYCLLYCYLFNLLPLPTLYFNHSTIYIKQKCHWWTRLQQYSNKILVLIYKNKLWKMVCCYMVALNHCSYDCDYLIVVKVLNKQYQLSIQHFFLIQN